jgi:hypothetical protein
MAEDRTQAPSAEKRKDRFPVQIGPLVTADEDLGDKANLGQGDQEPDPATGETPPSDIKPGDEKRVQT